MVDLVVLNEHPASYLEELQEQLQGLVCASDAHVLIDKPGGVFIRRASQLSEDDTLLLQAAARVVLVGGHGSLISQVDRAERAVPLPGRLSVTERRREPELDSGAEPAARQRPPLLFENGIGGFTQDGREYWLFPYERAHDYCSRGRYSAGSRPLALPRTGEEELWFRMGPQASASSLDQRRR